MIRTNIHLPKDQLERLRRVAETKDTSVAELVRRAVEAYLRAEEKNAKGKRNDQG
jgi:metal-responsive CopG/Arc/MetJ family transcriptional regulator